MSDTADELLESHKFSDDGSIWAPESLQQVRDRLEFIDAHECDCDAMPHSNALHDLAHDDVPVLLRVIEQLTPRRIETREELDALPPETIVKTQGGTVACRFYDRIHGVVFGDERPFKWPDHLVSELPATVLWSPEASR
ncbi:hypothetical protein [Mycolicibacterium brisbanense]